MYVVVVGIYRANLSISLKSDIHPSWSALSIAEEGQIPLLGEVHCPRNNEHAYVSRTHAFGNCIFHILRAARQRKHPCEERRDTFQVFHFSQSYNKIAVSALSRFNREKLHLSRPCPDARAVYRMRNSFGFLHSGPPCNIRYL